jgi:Ca-activated chloride channel family protein
MNIPHLEFGAPWVLLLLLLLPIWWVWRRRRRPAAIVFSRVSVLAAGPRAGRAIARSLVVARNLVLAGLIVALARPRSAGRAEQSTTEGINIVIAFDISSSMLAEDFQPQNRLEVARDKVKQFIAMRGSDRIGVVAFSGEALTQVPLTTDYPVVMAAVDNLQPGQLEDGTAIGTAIATAANRLRDAPGNSRVVVLLTDGVNNRGSIDPRTAAQAASAFGVKIYTIGVGTEGMAPVPVAVACSGCGTRIGRSRSTTHCSRTSRAGPVGGTSGRVTPRRCNASPRKSIGWSARPCARAYTRATRSCIAGRSVSRSLPSRWS